MNKIWLKINVTVFVLMIMVPLLVTVFGLDRGFGLDENRNLAKMPIINRNNVLDYSQSFLNYWNDNFGLREILISINSKFKLFTLKSSPNSQVIIGKDGRLFYSPDKDYTDTLNAKPFSDSELSQIKINLEKMDQYFASRNAKFYIMIAPKTQTIYPEFLPDNFKLANPNSRADQLTEYLKDSQIKIVNPKNVLIDAKDDQIYYKYGSHWNQRGALIASQTLADEIKKDFPAFPVKNLEEYDVSYATATERDLVKLLGTLGYPLEEEPVLKAKNQSFQITNECLNVYDRCDIVKTGFENDTLPKAVIYRDSFGSWLIPYLSEGFSSATYLWLPKPTSLEYVEKEQPDIVIIEIAERSLEELLRDYFRY